MSRASARGEALAAISYLYAIGYLDEEQLGSMFRLSLPTLRSWRSRRQGPPFVTVGRRTLYAIEDVRAWLTANRVPTGSPVNTARPHGSGAKRSRLG